jgi:hypothetical protein
MGIGRREFLKLFGSALAAMSVSPNQAIAILNDLYVNWKLGIAFQKPSGWHFASVSQMAGLAAGQILNLDDFNLSDEEMETARFLLQPSDFGQLITISKEPFTSSTDRFGPGIMIELDDVREMVDGPFADAAQNDIVYCRTLLKRFEVLKDPEPCTISGCPAVDYLCTFLFENEKMSTPAQVNMRTLAIYQNPPAYVVRMYDSLTLGKTLSLITAISFRAFVWCSYDRLAVLAGHRSNRGA